MLCTGQVYRSALTVHGQGTQPSTITLKIKAPDGTETTPAVGPGAASGPDWVVTYDYTLPAPGLYRFTWSTTGPGTAPPPDYVSVRDYISLVSLEEMKAHLNMSTSTADDDELTSFMQAATELVEARGGYTIRRTFTDRVHGNWNQTYLALPRRPVLSVTSVVSTLPGGGTWTPGVDGFDIDGDAGVISLASLYPFTAGPWTVTYEVGRAVPLEKHLHAVKEQVRHLWQTQRGPSPQPPLAGEETFGSGFGWSFSVPRRVLELLEDEQVPSI